jgi:outer membrane protein OmpU
MNNLKKIGLSALAGSLVAFSASASEVTVTGDTIITWKSAEGNENGAGASNGRGTGVDTDLAVNASGELDNGFTVDFFMALDTDSAVTNSSSFVTVGMGDLGKLRVNNNTGSGANSIDDVLPTAWEEVWDATTHTAKGHTFGANTAAGSLTYYTPSIELAGTSISATATYDNATGTHASAKGVSSGASGTAYTIAIAHESGLTIGGGIESEDDAGLGASTEYGETSTTAYAKFAAGPISIGYQETMIDPGYTIGTSTAATADVESTGYGIAYSMDNFSVSYAEVEEDRKNTATTTNTVDTEMSAINASYTMGALSASIGFFETSNPDFVDNTSYEATVLNLSFAF